LIAQESAAGAVPPSALRSTVLLLSRTLRVNAPIGSVTFQGDFFNLRANQKERSPRPAISLKAAAPNSSPQPALSYGAMRMMRIDTPGGFLVKRKLVVE